MPASPAHILEQFIHDEAAALLQEEQGSFYPSNHHLIKPLVAKATRLLPPPQQVELYFHLLRLNVCPPVKTAAEFEALGAAYTRVLTLFEHGYPVCRLHRPKGLFLFGRNHQGSLAREPVATHETYARHLGAWRYLDGFAHMPGMLSKKAKFAELGADQAMVERVTQVLLRTDLVKELPSATCLWFWAMVFLALHAPAAGGTVVNWLVQAAAPTPDHRFYLENLARYLRAARRDDLLSRLDTPLKDLDDNTR